LNNSQGDWTTLGEIAQWGSGGTPSAGDASFYGGEIPWAVIGDLDDGAVTSTAKTITQKGLDNSSAKLVPEGAVLIAMYGSIGKLGINVIQMATNQAIAFAIPNIELIDRDFLFWLLMHERPKFVKEGKGATQQNISQTLLKAWKIWLPALDQQREIVERIESALAKLEASENQIDEVLLRLEDARRATLRDAFEPADAIPKRDWQGTSLGDVVSIGRRKPSELKGSHDEVSFLPMAAVEEISGVLDQSERISHSAAQQKSLTYFVDGDVLFAKVTPCMENGKVTIAKNLFGGCGYGSTEFFPVVPSDRIRGDFLRYFLLNNKFREEAARSMTGAVGLKRVPKTFIESYPIYLPPLGQQESIVQRLEESLSALGALRSTAIDVRKNISLIKRSLLHQAFASREESSV
jgi:type I restriction enzyme S subunit